MSARPEWGKAFEGPWPPDDDVYVRGSVVRAAMKRHNRADIAVAFVIGWACGGLALRMTMAMLGVTWCS